MALIQHHNFILMVFHLYRLKLYRAVTDILISLI